VDDHGRAATPGARPDHGGGGGRARDVDDEEIREAAEKTLAGPKSAQKFSGDKSSSSRT
jgi:hypothetical protein